MSLITVEASAATYPAKWSKSPAPIRCFAGKSATVRVTLKASKSIGKVSLKLSSGLPGVASVSPTVISGIKKGAKKTISVKVTLPSNVTLGTFSAKVTAKSKGKNIAPPLAVKLTAAAAPVEYNSAAPVDVTQQTVGASGAVITAPGGSPIGGAQVGVPAGALAPGWNFALGYETGSMQPKAGQYSGFALELDATAPSGQRNPATAVFDQPVTVTLPIAQPGKIPVVYNIEPDGTLQLAQLTGIDTAAGTFSFQTFHESRYTVIYTLPARSASAMPDSEFRSEATTLQDVSTNFFTTLDGFQKGNPGSGFNPGGECWGMVSFALWYFKNAMPAKGWLYPRFMDRVSPGGATGQAVISTRAHIAIARYWASYYENLADTSQQGLTPAVRYTNIVNAMKNTSNPVLVYLAKTTPGSHAVMATQVNGVTGDITIYDPNKPGHAQIIDWDDAQQKLLPYEAYTFVSFLGDGSLHVKEDFALILSDAEDGFHGSESAQIIVQSHKPYKKASAGPPRTPEEGVVTDRNITLTGRFHSGSVKIEEIHVFVGDQQFSTNVVADSGGSGSFSIPVSLKAGMNTLNYVAVGYDRRNQRIGLPSKVYYDKDGDGLADPHRNHERKEAELVSKYQIKLNAGLAVMLVTLTWNTPSTDVDLYVTDPTGATSWYSGRTTPSGGTLDHDVTRGFGPEHFTLLDSNTIQWGQPYTVRVHYYSDRSDPENPIPSNYTVTVDTYEGTPRATSQTFTGTLVGDSSSNASPGSGGIGWADVCTVTLTEPPETP